MCTFGLGVHIVEVCAFGRLVHILGACLNPSVRSVGEIFGGVRVNFLGGLGVGWVGFFVLVVALGCGVCIWWYVMSGGVV